MAVWPTVAEYAAFPTSRQHGFKWGRIERRLDGRTPHAIRNRFYRLQQQQQQELGGLGPA